ncbi:zinc finger, CCHC-type containing protein [Tanacetum coccineum]
MFMLNLNKVLDDSDSVYLSSSTVVNSLFLHACLGHVHYKRMLEMSKDELIPVIDENPNKCNKKYVITFIDDASRFCYVYLLHAKDEALDKFRIYKTEVELQQRIIHETKAPYTPQQNGMAERKNKALKEMVNSMLSYSVLSEGFWGEAMGGTDQNQVDKTKKFLSSKFSMKDMGEADVILGIKIKHENKGIVITQSHYIEKILKKFNREDCSPVSTPMDPVEKLKPNTGKPVDQLEYSRAIRCLMYAMTSTRPDIAYAVGRLSRFTSNPSRQHWQAKTRVFKYLKGTMNYGLSYMGYPSVLKGYSDASWINHVEDSSSMSGWMFLLEGGAISWASKKQTCITGSTMESEFVALAAAGVSNQNSKKT